MSILTDAMRVESLDQISLQLKHLPLLELAVVANRAIEANSTTKAEAVRKLAKLVKYLSELQEEPSALDDLIQIDPEILDHAIPKAKTEVDRALLGHASITAHQPEFRLSNKPETDLRTRDVNAMLSDRSLAIGNVSAAYDNLAKNDLVVDVTEEISPKVKSQKVYRITPAGIARAITLAKATSTE